MNKDRKSLTHVQGFQLMTFLKEKAVLVERLSDLRIADMAAKELGFPIKEGFALAITRLANAPLGLRSFLLYLRPFKFTFSGQVIAGQASFINCGIRKVQNYERTLSR